MEPRSIVEGKEEGNREHNRRINWGRVHTIGGTEGRGVNLMMKRMRVQRKKREPRTMMRIAHQGTIIEYEREGRR